ncbi:hypothetical protein L218DRAFT_943864 [Marasmius fiardii PR-910]|nr:hypothetical protein L218DRAFT_943864 [Marasmius fiardii PR-910]
MFESGAVKFEFQTNQTRRVFLSGGVKVWTYGRDHGSETDTLRYYRLDLGSRQKVGGCDKKWGPPAFDSPPGSSRRGQKMRYIPWDHASKNRNQGKRPPLLLEEHLHGALPGGYGSGDGTAFGARVSTDSSSIWCLFPPEEYYGVGPPYPASSLWSLPRLALGWK